MDIKESYNTVMQQNVNMQMREVGYLEEIRLLRKMIGFKKREGAIDQQLVREC